MVYFLTILLLVSSDCFGVLTVGNSVTVNMEVNLYNMDFFSWNIHPEVRLLDKNVVLKNLHPVLYGVCINFPLHLCYVPFYSYMSTDICF